MALVRSEAYGCANDWQHALQDARRGVALAPNWAKVHPPIATSLPHFLMLIFLFFYCSLMNRHGGEKLCVKSTLKNFTMPFVLSSVVCLPHCFFLLPQSPAISCDNCENRSLLLDFAQRIEEKCILSSIIVPFVI